MKSLLVRRCMFRSKSGIAFSVLISSKVGVAPRYQAEGDSGDLWPLGDLSESPFLRGKEWDLPDAAVTALQTSDSLDSDDSTSDESSPRSPALIMWRGAFMVFATRRMLNLLFHGGRSGTYQTLQSEVVLRPSPAQGRHDCFL